MMVACGDKSITINGDFSQFEMVAPDSKVELFINGSEEALATTTLDANKSFTADIKVKGEQFVMLVINDSPMMELITEGKDISFNYNAETMTIDYAEECLNERMRDIKNDISEKMETLYTAEGIYANGQMSDVDRRINEALIKRFGKGIPRNEQGEKTQVTKNCRAKIWYVVRFLDGFVLDTNIAEIRQYLFDEKAPTCEVFSYSPSDDEGKSAEEERQAIGAWYYCIPQMHYGAYGQIATTSGYAYGAAGLSGTTTTETSSSNSMASYYNAMNYYNYYNSYYNYYSPYYNYYDYNYYNYNYNYDTGEETTTTTISTEILPYTPLVFTIFVEPNE